MSRNARLVLVAVYGLIGVLVLVWVGWVGLLVYAFLLGIVLALALGATTGGDWLRDVSSRRFDDRER